jgi:aminoglycoside phosphotransferase (APT) family kinase protein
MTATVPVREAHRIDEARLAAWMVGHVSGFRGPLQVDQFAGGQSNPTYRLRTREASYVLRRKPLGPLLKGAHAIEREARVISALEKACFPVPRVHGLCEDPDVIDSEFYVMDLVEGRIFWNASFSQLPKNERAARMDAMNATMALHRIDPGAVGLGDCGRIGGYVARQGRAGRSSNLERRRRAGTRPWTAWSIGCPHTCRWRQRQPSCTETSAPTT